MQCAPRLSRHNGPITATLFTTTSALLALAVLPGTTQAASAPLARLAAAGSVGWTLSSHPCPGGNRTDALQLDADGTVWVGSGTAASGYGLYVSQDGGIQWTAANVSPSDMFINYRVNSISREHDDALYIAGMASMQGALSMVLRVDTTASPSPVTLVLSGGATLDTKSHVGNYRELPDGQAFADDLNGYGLLYRPASTSSTFAQDWEAVGSTHQILDMTLDQTGQYLFAGGSSNEPPRVFLPPRTAGAEPWELETFALPTTFNFDGEIWGVAASNNYVYAVGVDQDSDTGTIFLSGADTYMTGDYSELSVTDFLNPGGGTGTWARGVCARDNTVVVVGERQPISTNGGSVVLSTGAAMSFTDVTPVGVGASVSKRGLSLDGGLILAGAAGFVGMVQGHGIF